MQKRTCPQLHPLEEESFVLAMTTFKFSSRHKKRGKMAYEIHLDYHPTKIQEK